MVEPIKMSFEGADSCGPKEARIEWGQGWTNPLAAASGDKMVMQPFIKII